jgi:hypothetical protein
MEIDEMEETTAEFTLEFQQQLEMYLPIHDTTDGNISH